MRITDTANVYFTADTHYAHKNICSGVTRWGSGRAASVRPHASLDEMNDAIVGGINRAVPSDGLLFHLGDWSFGGYDRMLELRRRINCRTIHLIRGNHDSSANLQMAADDSLFESVSSYTELRVPEDMVPSGIVALFHYPIAEWNKCHRGSIHLHGHVHRPPATKVSDRRLDVGVDGRRGTGRDYEPYSLAEICDALKDEKPLAHH